MLCCVFRNEIFFKLIIRFLKFSKYWFNQISYRQLDSTLGPGLETWFYTQMIDKCIPSNYPHRHCGITHKVIRLHAQGGVFFSPLWNIILNEFLISFLAKLPEFVGHTNYITFIVWDNDNFDLHWNTIHCLISFSKVKTWFDCLRKNSFKQA